MQLKFTAILAVTHARLVLPLNCYDKWTMNNGLVLQLIWDSTPFHPFTIFACLSITFLINIFQFCVCGKGSQIYHHRHYYHFYTKYLHLSTCHANFHYAMPWIPSRYMKKADLMMTTVQAGRRSLSTSGYIGTVGLLYRTVP